MKYLVLLTLLFMTSTGSYAQLHLESDHFKTPMGDLEIFFVGHGTLMMKIDGKVIHIDPVLSEYDYTKMPDADLILVTHQHGDHLDAKAIGEILTPATTLVMPPVCKEAYTGKGNILVMKNGEEQKVAGIDIKAYPAYNLEHKRSDGNPFHPKGEGNAYLLNFGGFKVLVGGDTENIPELKALSDIDVAFLPMNLPYTMTPEMVADLALAMKPAILYPYHFGKTDTGKIKALLKDHPEIEVRLRDLD
ncbi:MAG: MBL fold metallo-hydrolase [Bacteroidota bacterium]